MPKTHFISIIYLFILFFSIGCGSKNDEKYTPIKNSKTIDSIKFSALPKTVTSPKDNVSTPAKIKLGKLLFFDPILSGNKDISCATCHHPDFGYAEFRDISIGVNGKGLGSKRMFKVPNTIPFVKRNAHTILNTAFNGIDNNLKYNSKNAPMFWDNRSNSLEKQALEPIKSLEEMRGTTFEKENILDEIVRRLKEIPEYEKLFKNAFGTSNAINQINLSKAIAAFERTLITSNSRFDKYITGDQNAMSISEKEGFALFKKVGCANCHSGPMFSDYKMHVLGVKENDKLPEPDSGFNNQFAFRTPTLRNLRHTAPYMHNGREKTLKKVLEFYEDIASGKSQNPNVADHQLDSLVKKITIKTKDFNLIISFLNTLNSDDFDKKIVDAVPSGLTVGGNIK